MKKSKKIIIAVSAVLAVAVAACTAFYFSQKSGAKETVKLADITSAEDITLTAHRGLSSQAPENTLPALSLAGEYGYKYAEIDIQLTKDGVWVLSHDDSIGRMTDGRGKISGYTYFELADFTINNGANYKNYDNLKMPSLDAALDTCLESGVIPMIEIKNYTDKALKSLSDSIVNHGYQGSCYVISFNREALNKLGEINPEIKMLWLVSEFDDETINTCIENPQIGVSFKADIKKNTADKLSKLQKAGIELFCWTVNDKQYIDFYYPLGVKNFVTDLITP